MVEYHTLPPISVSALTELWNFLRLDTIEGRRLEILQTEGAEGLVVYDAVLKFLNTYILVAEDRMPEELFNTELRRMLPIIRQARRHRERIVVGPINEILLAILRKLEMIAKTPRLYSREDKVLTFDQLASFWHTGAFNLGRALGHANESLTFVARTVFRALATSREHLLEEERERLNRLRELGIPEKIIDAQRQWRTEN